MIDRKKTMNARLGVAAVAMTIASVTPASAQSIGDRFKNLFGGSSDTPQAAAPGQPVEADTGGLTCPDVSIRPGASTYAVGLPGKTASGPDLRYQATISRTARECSLNGGVVTARIGIQGRVIAGPAGAPAAVDVPVRVAVVQEGVSPKTIATKAYRTSVTMSADASAPFSLVIEDVAYPAPTPAAGDQYVFYIGFDPQALGPEPRAKKKR